MSASISPLTAASSSSSSYSSSASASLPPNKSVVSKAQRRANRANAKKSTGPRSEEGKKRSARNAISHGLFCQYLILPGERLHDFLVLRLAFHVDLRATDSIEFAIVERAVIAQWRMRRCQRTETNLHAMNALQIEQQSQEEVQKIQKSLDDICFDEEEEERAHKAKVQVQIDELEAMAAATVPFDATMSVDFDNPSSALDRLARYEHRLEHHFYKALRELRAHRKDQHGGKPPTRETREEMKPYANLGQMRREMEACAEEIEENIEEELENLDDELDDREDEGDASEEEGDEREGREEHEEHEDKLEQESGEPENESKATPSTAPSPAAAQNEANLIERPAGDDEAKSCERSRREGIAN